MNIDKIATYLLETHLSLLGDCCLYPESYRYKIKENREKWHCIDLDKGIYCTDEFLIKSTQHTGSIVLGALEDPEANIPSLFVKSGTRNEYCTINNIPQTKEFNRTFDLAVREAQYRLVKYFLSK